MDAEEFERHTDEWGRGDRVQRLGQYLINKMSPPVTDPEIFYETDHGLASLKFFERYVLKEA